MRTEYLKIIGNQSEKDLLNWANSNCAKSELHATSFRDSSISSGLWLINICNGIKNGCVNWEIVTPGTTDEEKSLNAKYAISIARMLGAVVFCVWEDIVASKEKMVLVFICALNEVSKNKAHGLKSPVEEAKQYQGQDLEENKEDVIESTPNEEYSPAEPVEHKEEKAKAKEAPKKAVP